MSTELLTRRMDLIHTSTSAINTLKMDTSYPVKLSGIVIKVFQAVSDYTNIDPATGNEFGGTTNLFFIQNQEGSPVTTIQKQNVFDFAGNRLKNKEYINGDYVLAIIDITNDKIFLHSIQNMNRTDSIYTKDMDYHCNGINDNTILGGITNILIDLYDYSQNINFDKDEFTYEITNAERQNIFPTDKFTINIIGKFGIDYSDTDFVYEDIDSTNNHSNRQNRSSIMKISGTSSSRTENVNVGTEKDLEMILNWEKCYVPKITYNNETCAAMYNTKLEALNGSNEVVYYDYWTHENEAHFKDSNGDPYGNLYPRRLIFASIEGLLPINVTFKNFSINTFGTAIYCQTESRKSIKLDNCKITINSIGNSDAWYLSTTKHDITSDNYFYSSLPVPSGCAVDINAFNPIVYITNCEIKNDMSCRNSNLIVNSCSNMIIDDSIINDFADNENGYKYGYNKACLDAEYFYDYYYMSEEKTYSVPSDCDMTNPNTLDSIIAGLMFYNATSANIKMSMDNIMTIPSKRLPLTGTNESDYSRFKTADFRTMDSAVLDIDYANRTITYTSYSTASKNGIKNCRVMGALKNIPVLYKDNYKDTTENNKKYLGMREYTGHSPIKDSTGSSVIGYGESLSSNKETIYMPKLFINNCVVKCAGILFQYNSSTRFSNSTLFAKLFDHRYIPIPIRVLSGDLTIDNCDCSFDTRDNKYFSTDFQLDTMGYRGDLSFIKLYNNLFISNELEGHTLYDLNNYTYPAITPINSPKLNIHNSKVTLYPSLSYNSIPGVCSNGSNAITFTHTDGGYMVINSRSRGIQLSYIDSSISEVNDQTALFFNPILAPNINIESSEFLISDTYSRTELLDMGNHFDDKRVYETVGVIVRPGSTILNTLVEDNTKYTTTPSSYTYDSYSSYSNYVNAIRIIRNNDTVNKCIDKFFNINTGVVTTFTIALNNTVTTTTSSAFDLSDCTTNLSKLNKMGLTGYENALWFYNKLAEMNRDFSTVFDLSTKQIKWVDGNGVSHDMTSENIENHIIICYLYGSDLAHTGYYMYNSIRDLLNNSSTSLSSDIENQYNSFGVVGFKLENSVFNMSNCKIGGSNHTGSRNAYGMESFTRRSPRICFNFKSTGIYRVSNTNANAWGTVLWSSLNKNAKKAYDDYNYDSYHNYRVRAPFDFTALNYHNRGEMIINNCDFKNYSSLRVKQTSEDWMDYLNSNYTIITPGNPSVKEIYDKGNYSYSVTDNTNKNELRLQKSISNQTIIENTGSGSNTRNSEEGFNESVRNANEMPIIYINNIDLVDTKINNSNIMGNETIIVQGEVHFNNCTYLNLGNAMICYLGHSLSELNNNSKYYSIPKLFFKNSKIVAIKDVMYDAYIDHDRRRIYSKTENHNLSFEENCNRKGMDKYDNVISAFFVESDKIQVELDGNEIVSKCNSYNKIYGIKDAKIRVLYYKNCDSSPASQDIISFKNNNVVMIYDCPGFIDDLNTRVLPNSSNLSVIETDLNLNNNIEAMNTRKNISITGNTFNIMTLLNQDITYAIKVGKGDVETNTLNSLPVFYNAAPYNVYSENCVITETVQLEYKPNGSFDKIIHPANITYVRSMDNMKALIESNNYDKNMISTPISVFSETKLMNPFDPNVVNTNMEDMGTFNGYSFTADNNHLAKYVLSESEVLTSDISKVTPGSTTTQVRSDGTWTIKTETRTYNTSRYVVDKHAKISESTNDFNFVYSEFDTPILFSSEYYSINIDNNTFVNSTLDNDSLYVIGKDKFEVLHSPTIIDIYSKTDSNNKIVSESSYNNYKNISINNNIFTARHPKNILVSTEYHPQVSTFNIIDAQTEFVYSQYIYIQTVIDSITTKYFDYNIPHNGSTVYQNDYQLDNNSINDDIDIVTYNNHKSYDIKINNDLNSYHNMFSSISPDNYLDNIIFGETEDTKNITFLNSNNIALYAYRKIRTDSIITFDLYKLTSTSPFINFINEKLINFNNTPEFTIDSSFTENENVSRYIMNICPVTARSIDNFVSIDLYIYTTEYSDILKGKTLTTNSGFNSYKCNDLSIDIIPNNNTFTIEDNAIYKLGDEILIKIKFNSILYYISIGNLLDNTNHNSIREDFNHIIPKNTLCGFVYGYTNNKYHIVQFGIDSPHKDITDYCFTLDCQIAKGSTSDQELSCYCTYTDKDTGFVYRFSLSELFVIPESKSDYNEVTHSEITSADDNMLYMYNVSYQSYLLSAIQNGYTNRLYDTLSQNNASLITGDNYYSELMRNNININLTDRNNTFMYNNINNIHHTSLDNSNLKYLRKYLSDINSNITTD